jgi:NAD(P)-dependent dehydrogenase (short-subunit alcohol dehydrogenase family)
METGNALSGKSILVVGASAGLGRAIAEAAAREGAALTVAARRTGVLEEIAAGLDAEVAVVSCDATRVEDCDRAVHSCIERFGRMDILAYTAGTSPLGAISDTTVDEWNRMFQTNVMGAALTVAAAAPHLRRTRGRAFFISSASARALKVGLVPYSATKRALEAVVDGYRLEEPEIAFTTIVVASTGQTEFTREWDQEVAARYQELWKSKGLLTTGAFASERAFADLVMAVMAADIAVPELFVGPLPPDVPANATS